MTIRKEIGGSFGVPVIFKEQLTVIEKGRLLRSLDLEEKRALSRIQAKRGKFKSKKSLVAEARKEIDAMSSGTFYDDRHIGPVSILCDEMRLDLLIHAMDHLRENDSCIDTRLYDSLFQKSESRYPAKVKSGLLDEKSNIFGREKVLREVFDLFHECQSRFLKPTEQCLYSYALRSQKVTQPLPSYGFSASAVFEKPVILEWRKQHSFAAEIGEDIKQSKTESFLRLYHSFKKYPREAVKSLVAYRVQAAFEDLQMVQYCFDPSVSYGDLLYQNRSIAGVSLPFQEYDDYYHEFCCEEKEASAYLPDPDHISQKDRTFFLGYYDFSNTVVKEMTDPRAWYGYLQQQLDMVAANKKIPAVKLPEALEVMKSYQRPVYDLA